MAIKISSKVSKSTKETAKKEAVKLVQVPSQVHSAVFKTADAAYSADVAATSREQSIVGLGTLIGNTMGKNSREVTKVSVAPLFGEAFRKANEKLNTLPGYSAKNPHPRYKDDKALGLYIGQQLSRCISIAYPGGANASPQEAKAASENLAKAMKAGEKQDVLYKVASGSMGYKGGKLAVIKAHTRGGGNKKKPLDAARDSIKEAMTAAKAAKLTPEQFLLAVYDVGMDLKWWADEDEMKEFIS